MSGMGDGYVGTAQDAVRIRRLEKQREAERRKIQELKTKSASAKGQPGLLQFGSSTSEILETAFKKETVGLVTREQYVEKRVNIQSKIEEEEKEKLQKQQQEEEELQLEKRKKRKIKGNSRLSFAEDIDSETQEEEEEEPRLNNLEANRLRRGKLGKDPTVETGFLPDSSSTTLKSELTRIDMVGGGGCLECTCRVWSLCPCFIVPLYFSFLVVALTFGHRSAEDSCSVRERLRSKQSGKGCGNSGSVSRSKSEVNEPLEITYSYWDGTGHRRVIQVRKGDSIGEFLRAVQQQLAPEFREIRTTSVENLLYVKEDLIIPHQHSFYELIVNKARGKSGPLFHFDVHEDVRTIADATIEKDESHAGKVVERHWYEKNKHIFPASRWEIYDPTKKWERYTIHGD
ncbi:hypothetical protein LR48_Vigan325s002200 [Vigna angularis]|uniref:FAM50A/XAP5 C-terminal domain-containing protein n=1 Tax=Phaseolus angularis TaxID=3914 RepID=A0A0L9T8B4_PHAAN|nr:hypothetical protein LR48_Vigan325s002200 [Vigna angularis]